jgi:epoxide hydrolase-like predicted phosphatase
VIRAVVSDFGGVLTAPLLQGFMRMQDDTGVPPEAFGTALARATAANGGRNPLFELEVGAIGEHEFIAAVERELAAELGRPVTLHGFGERYMAALDPNDELFAHYRALHAGGQRLALLTNNVREWEPFWRSKLPIDEIFETVVDSAFVGVRKPDPAIYAIVLERLGLPAEECAFVDDIAVNVDAARELGFAAVHFRAAAEAIAELDALMGDAPGAASAASAAGGGGDASDPAIIVRLERPDDAAGVRRVHEAAFGQPAEADLVESLRASGELVPELCLVAERGGEVIGHIAFSRARLDSGDVVLALAPVGVLPEHQGAGAGSALNRAALERAAATELPLVVVLGHAGYYPRFGFEPAEPLGVRAPFDVPDENWMALRLPAYRPSARGTLRYAAAFDAVS